MGGAVSVCDESL